MKFIAQIGGKRFPVEGVDVLTTADVLVSQLFPGRKINLIWITGAEYGDSYELFKLREESGREGFLRLTPA